MNKPRIGSALCFAPLLALTLARPLPAADAPPPGGVEKEALQAGVYQVPANPPGPAAPRPPSPEVELPLTLLPAYQVTGESAGRLYYQLKAAMSWNASQPRSLIATEFAYGPSIRAFEEPQLGQVSIPWTPMVTEEPMLSVNYPNYVSDRLQVRFPLVDVVW